MAERIVNLCRLRRSDQGTQGMLLFEDFNCHTLELPWRDNQRSISCIPAGEYKCQTRQSPKFGTTYHVTEVPGRSYVLIHSGNWAGDVNKGFKSHVNGCILLGQKAGWLAGQRAVLNSRITIKRFMEYMSYEPFTLKILEAF
jgi:hypothetical protein